MDQAARGPGVIVAGIGCRRGVSAGEVIDAIGAALTACGRSRAEVSALATGSGKAGEPAIVAAADRLGLPLLLPDQGELAAVSGSLLSRSERSLGAAGTGSLSEAAALAGAGPGARLLAPRSILGPVTCALAEGGAR